MGFFRELGVVDREACGVGLLLAQGQREHAAVAEREQQPGKNDASKHRW